jgi:hypothetical protein
MQLTARSLFIAAVIDGVFSLLAVVLTVMAMARVARQP